VIALGAAHWTGAALGADDGERAVTVRLAERLTQEDNLYRLPNGVPPSAMLDGDVSRDDLVSSASIALAGRWQQGDQQLALDATAAANRFADNADLDNTSGRGALEWSWRLGSRWSGQTGGRRERSLAGFANSTSLDKDVLDTTTYHVDLGLELGPRLRAVARAPESTTSPDDDARRRDEGEVEASSVGLEYRSPSNNTVGVEYHGATATFPEHALAPASSSPSDYDERGASVKVRYAATDEVALEGSIGRVERTYDLAPRGDFSGDVWNATLSWSPTESTRISVARYRELKAHLDAESDHFVANGVRVAASWFPVTKLALGVQVDSETQHYIGADVDVLVDARSDEPLSASLTATYQPRERTTLEIALWQETRDSNRGRFEYEARALSVAAEVKF
jgi:hypothetical protein